LAVRTFDPLIRNDQPLSASNACCHCSTCTTQCCDTIHGSVDRSTYRSRCIVALTRSVCCADQRCLHCACQVDGVLPDQPTNQRLTLTPLQEAIFHDIILFLIAYYPEASSCETRQTQFQQLQTSIDLLLELAPLATGTRPIELQ